jgi:hypothetical protein
MNTQLKLYTTENLNKTFKHLQEDGHTTWTTEELQIWNLIFDSNS